MTAEGFTIPPPNILQNPEELIKQHLHLLQRTRHQPGRQPTLMVTPLPTEEKKKYHHHRTEHTLPPRTTTHTAPAGGRILHKPLGKPRYLASRTSHACGRLEGTAPLLPGPAVQRPMERLLLAAGGTARHFFVGKLYRAAASAKIHSPVYLPLRTNISVRRNTPLHLAVRPPHAASLHTGARVLPL